MNTREIIFSIILFVFAVMIWQLLEDESPDLVENIGPQEVFPGYYIKDAELIRYNKSGQAEYTIKAEKIEQDLATNDLKLSNIQVNYHAQGNWVINARQATLPASRQNIRFLGNVQAIQDGANKTSFTSDSLNYNIAEQKLTTTDAIEAVKGAQVITAKGMAVDMKNERIKLLSRVKIRFKP